MNINLTVYRDWCLEVQADKGNPFESWRFRIGKRWPETYPNWYAHITIKAMANFGKCNDISMTNSESRFFWLGIK